MRMSVRGGTLAEARFWVLMLALLGPSLGFYLPGVAPTSYKIGDLVPLNVNHLSPGESETDSQVHSVFSYDYYKPQFHFCQPKDGPQQQSESIGSILFGDRILTSPFELKMGVNETCKSACQPQVFSPGDSIFVNERISQDYVINWFVDGLPAAQLRKEVATGKIYEFPSFPLGYMDDDGKPLLNNHYDLFLDYHQAAEAQYRVVGVVVQASSRKGNTVSDDGKASCAQNEQPLSLSEKDETRMAYTYSIFWRESSTTFATRWDKYLHVYNPEIHWISVANSTLILFLLVGVVFVILYRNLRRDITRYNRIDEYALEDLSGTSLTDDGFQEDSGWKLVHGDVFRPPRNPLLLSILVGNGVQLVLMAGLTIAFAMLGFLSPSNRGSLTTVMIILYTLFSFVGGYVSTKIYQFFHGDSFKINVALTPLTLPVVVFGTFFILNLVVWARRASGAIPFWTMLFLVSIWLIISLPLSAFGSWLALKQPPLERPMRINQIPRQIPLYRGCLGSTPAILLIGLLPFSAIFVELYFIMNSIWYTQFYYMFGFLFLCFGIMVMTCAVVTILFVYFFLCEEDYHWQWRSVLAAGASSIYVFLYAMLYWMRTLSFSSWTSGVLYLGYSILISFLVFVLTGSIGFLASLFFVLKIYKFIKVE